MEHCDTSPVACAGVGRRIAKRVGVLYGRWYIGQGRFVSITLITVKTLYPVMINMPLGYGVES